MSDQPAQTPLIELARRVPKDFRGEWEIQWADDGRPTGHSMAPVGKYLHDMADELDILRHRLVAEKAMRERQAKRIEELEAITAEAVDDARLLGIDNERLRAENTKLLAVLQDEIAKAALKGAAAEDKP